MRNFSHCTYVLELEFFINSIYDKGFTKSCVHKKCKWQTDLRIPVMIMEVDRSLRIEA